MSTMPRLSVIRGAALTMVASLALTACTTDEQTDSTSVPPGATGALATTGPVSRTETPVVSTTTPPGLEAATGPVVVVAIPTSSSQQDPNAADLDVRLIDLGTTQTLAQFPVTGASIIPGRFQLVGQRIVVLYPDRIAWYAADGSGSGTVVTAPAGFELLSFDVSVDGTRIAYWKSPLGHGTPETWEVSLVLADVASRRVLVEVEDFGGRADGKPAVMVDAFGQYSAWMPGGEAVIANIGGSHDRSLRKVTIDGTVAEVIPRGRWGTFGQPGTVSPSLTTAFYPVSAFSASCSLVDSKDPQAPLPMRGIRNLETNTDFWSEPADRYAWSAYGSPDGQSFLFAEFECPRPDQQERHWRLVTTASQEATEVPDPLVVLREWYGDRLPTVRCGTALDLPGKLGLPRVWDLRWGFVQPACDGPVELLVGDSVVATEPSSAEARFLVLGFIEAP